MLVNSSISLKTWIVVYFNSLRRGRFFFQYLIFRVQTIVQRGCEFCLSNGSPCLKNGECIWANCNVKYFLVDLGFYWFQKLVNSYLLSAKIHHTTNHLFQYPSFLQVRVEVNGEDTRMVFDKVLTNLARTAPPVPGFRKQKGGNSFNSVTFEYLIIKNLRLPWIFWYYKSIQNWTDLKPAFGWSISHVYRCRHVQGKHQR